MNTTTPAHTPGDRPAGTPTAIPLFNANGVHWQQHGQEVAGMQGDTRMTIRSYCSQLDEQPSVLVYGYSGAFSMNLHLLPDDADALAQALLAAAQRSRQVAHARPAAEGRP